MKLLKLEYKKKTRIEIIILNYKSKEMKIYRVAYRDELDEHNGYEYFSNKAEAIRADNKNKGNTTRDEIEEIEIQPTKKGIISALNIYCSYPDNG